MIVSLKVEQLFNPHSDAEWQAEIEIDNRSPLEELHDAIIDAVRFDDDHMYGFYTARTALSRNKVWFDAEEGIDRSIESLYPLEKRRDTSCFTGSTLATAGCSRSVKVAISLGRLSRELNIPSW